jgi:Dolichyl-phosphate-mannose-protein mannosyltransferase
MQTLQPKIELTPEQVDAFEKPKAPNRFLLIGGFAVALTAILIFAPTRAAAFLADDWVIINQLTFKYPTFFDNLVWFSRDWGVGVNFYRPLVRLMYYFQFLFFGANPAGWHLISVLLHAFNSLLVFGLAWRISSRAGVGLLAGMLFALHPIHSEPVTWISGQTDLWAALWCLSSALCFVTMRQVQREGSSGRRWLVASIVFFFLGLLSKESAIALPLALVVYDFSKGGLDRLFFPYNEAPKNHNNTLIRLIGTHAPFWILLAIYFGWRFILFGGLGGYATPAGETVDVSLFLRLNLKWLLTPFSLTGPDGLILLGAVGAFLALTIVQEWERFRIRLGLPLETPEEQPKAKKKQASSDPDLDDLPGNGAVARLEQEVEDNKEAEPTSHVRPPYYTARTALYGFLWTLIFLLPSLFTPPAERFTYLPSAGFVFFFGAILTPFASDYKLFKRDKDLSFGDRIAGLLDLSTFLRLITVVAVLMTYLATTNTRVSNWLTASDSAEKVLAITKEVIPGVRNYEVIYGQNVPEVGNNALIFRTGYTDAIQLLYKNNTLEVFRVSRFPIVEQKLDRTIFLEYQLDRDRLVNRQDIQKTLLKRNEEMKNQITFQSWDFGRPLGSVNVGGPGTWFENSGTGKAEQRNGSLVISAPGTAVLQSPDFLTGNLTALRLGNIEITLKASANSQVFRGEVAWAVSGTPNTSAQATGFDIVADGQFRTYRVKPEVSTFFVDDNIARITLTLPPGIGEVEILKIEQKILPPLN